jgi:hypothetical protein
VAMRADLSEEFLTLFELGRRRQWLLGVRAAKDENSAADRRGGNKKDRALHSTFQDSALARKRKDEAIRA